MALGPTLVIAFLLTFAADISFGSVPRCLTKPLGGGWISVECDGTDYGKDLEKSLSRPELANASRLALTLNRFSPGNRSVFTRFTNLTYLRIRSDNVSAVLNEMTELKTLKHLNLSSNRMRELLDLSYINQLEVLDLSNNSLRQVDLSLIPLSIKSLDLRSNNIEMDSNVTLPKGLKRLDLSDNRMNRVRPILSETLIRLNLSGNNVSDLSFVSSLITVEELDISNNNISQIEDDTFLMLSSLIRLDLSRNFIKSLKEKSFSGLNRLQIIDLSCNLLQTITPGTFQYLSNLLWLNLANNTDLGNSDEVQDSSILLGAGQKLQTVDSSRTNLTKVPNTLTRSIRNLYLSSNRISTIRCGDFDSFLLLHFLDLTSNNISVVEDDAFGRLELLYYLLLSDNSLTSLPHSLPDNLLVLDLDRNRIQNLTVTDFFGLSKLKTLRLAWNKIAAVQDGAFGQLSALQSLDLSGNPIKMLSGSTFVGPRRLIDLSLASLTHILPTNDTLSFPVPESSHLQILNLESSPVLVIQLMNDVAALSMFRHINVLNLAFSDTERLRSDLVNFFPRLQALDLRGNRLDCTDAIWLADWLRRLRDENSEDSRLQLLGEDEETLENRTDFDVQTGRLKASPTEESPKCASPENLAGVSLYDLRDRTPATAHPPRYDRINFNITNQHDHEFYQNDFPSPLNEQKVPHRETKSPESEKRQAKLSNTTETASLRSSVVLQNNNHSLNKTIKNLRNNSTTDKKDFTLTGREHVKAEYLRSDNKIKLSESENKTVDANKTNKISAKSNKSSSLILEPKADMISIFSPLDVTLHERTDSESGEDSVKADTRSVSSAAQKVSVDDLDTSKDTLDEDDDDNGQDDNEARYTHHPGLLVFFVAAGILGVTALAMKASQRRQGRHGYAQQQDIEVRSLDLSAHELW